MIAADALYRDDLSRLHQFPGRTDTRLSRRSSRRAIRQQQLVLRSADAAGIRLRMKTPIRRVLILPLTIRAHRKLRHRRPRPVIRHAADDGIPRTAIRAVDERIPVPAVRRRQKLAPAILTNRQIRRNQRLRRLPCRARQDTEARFPLHRQLPHLDGLDQGSRRRCFPQRRRKGQQGIRRALSLEQDPLAVIFHPASQAMLYRLPIHKRAIPDSLHDTAHPYPHPFQLPCTSLPTASSPPARPSARAPPMPAAPAPAPAPPSAPSALSRPPDQRAPPPAPRPQESPCP